MNSEQYYSLVLDALLAERGQFAQHEVLGINQLCAAINNPFLAYSTCGTLATRPLGPILQVAVFIHATSANSEYNGLAEALSSLAKACLNTSGHAAISLVPRLRCGRWHCASGICAAGVKVEISLCFLESTGTCVGWIHERLRDLGECEILVRWKEILDARDDVLKIRADPSVLELVRESFRQRTETSEEVGTPRCLRGLCRCRRYHRHPGDLPDTTLDQHLEISFTLPQLTA